MEPLRWGSISDLIEFAIKEANQAMQENENEETPYEEGSVASARGSMKTIQAEEYWRVFTAKVKQVIQEATSYKQILDIKKQASTDISEFLIKNKYQQSAIMKEFIEYVVDIMEVALLCRETSVREKGRMLKRRKKRGK